MVSSRGGGGGNNLLRMAEGKRLEKAIQGKTTKMSKEDYDKHLTERLGEDENYVSKENRRSCVFLHSKQRKTKTEKADTF